VKRCGDVRRSQQQLGYDTDTPVRLRADELTAYPSGLVDRLSAWIRFVTVMAQRTCYAETKQSKDCVTATKARFPFKRNRLRWQAASLPLRRPSIPIGWRLRLLREIFKYY